MGRYKIWIGIAVALTLLFLGGTTAYLVNLRRQVSEFDCEENDKDYKNPARGMYVQVQHTESPEYIDSIAEKGIGLVLITMDLQNYTLASISDEELSSLRTLLDRCRDKGLMVMFRASYKQEEGMEEPTLDRIHEHIEQLAKILNEHKDEVLLVQAGMIGLWGEWHSSEYLRDEDAIRTEARQVVSWWLDKLDESIVLNLRRPSYIRLLMSAGLSESRLGYHDDGLLGSDTDLGTYEDREEELAWCESHLNGKFNGGEMPYVNSYSEPENAVKEFNQLALTYLNYYYNTEVLDDWRSKTLSITQLDEEASQNEKESASGSADTNDAERTGEVNAYDYIERHLGYRYYIDRVTIQKYLFRRQGSFHIRLELGNSGFSAIHSRFSMYLVLDDGENKTYVPLEVTDMDKSQEVYEADIPMESYAPVRIGFCCTDAIHLGKDENRHYVEFANDETVYKDGINYLLQYDWDGRMKNRLIAGELSSQWQSSNDEGTAAEEDGPVQEMDSEGAESSGDGAASELTDGSGEGLSAESTSSSGEGTPEGSTDASGEGASVDSIGKETSE